MATNTIYQQSEVVRTKFIPMWMEMKYNVLTDFIEKGEVETVGERDYRIPFQQTFGGRGGHYDPQAGDMGRGSSPTGNVLLQSYYNWRLNFEFNSLQIKATTSRKVAQQNPFLKCVSDGMAELVLLWDKIIHGDGTAFLATSVSVSNTTGVTVYTMDNLFGVQLLRRGQFYNVYDSTGTVLKSAGTLFAQQIFTQNRTLTLSGIVPNAAAGDRIAFEGVSGANPAGPRGLKYWISNNLSGTTAGINRAVETQVIAKSVSGINGLTSEAVMALYHQILMDRGAVANDLIGICAPAQQAYAYSQMMAIQMDLVDKAEATAVDRLPKIKGLKAFQWGGMPHYVDIHQDQTTIPYINPKEFGKARLAPTGFFETPGKSGPDARFIQLMAGSGGPQAAVWFGLTKDEDLYNVNPGGQGVITNLPLSSYYQ